jgi:intein/homing endonuclease
MAFKLPFFSDFLDKYAKVQVSTTIGNAKYSRRNTELMSSDLGQGKTGKEQFLTLHQLVQDRSSVPLTDMQVYAFSTLNVARKVRYHLYDMMEDWHPEISSVLDTIADEICIRGFNNEIFQVEVKLLSDTEPTEQEKIEMQLFETYLNDLFFNRLNISKKLWFWARNLAKYGDWFIEPVLDKNGVIDAKIFYDIDQIYKVDDNFSLPYYVYITTPKQTGEIPTVARDYGSQILWQPSTISYFIPSNPDSYIVYFDGELIHFKLDNKAFYHPYGTSHLDCIRQTWEILKRVEDAMMVYRMVRAPSRKIFYVNVGSLPPSKVWKEIENVKQILKRQASTNAWVVGGGTAFNSIEDVDKSFRFIGVDEDYYIPQTGDKKQVEIDELREACLTLDTEIYLQGQGKFTLSEIIEKYKSGESLKVYSINPYDGKPSWGDITFADITRPNAEVVKVVFESGKEVICTPDHSYPVYGKGKIEAKDLKPGDPIFCAVTPEDIYQSSKIVIMEQVNENTYAPTNKIEAIEQLMIKVDRVKVVETLEQKVDTGTITVEGSAYGHDYHTFLLGNGIFTYNSNLDKIADVEYFKTKMYSGLRVPKAYLAHETEINRATLVQQDVRFAKLVTRYQEALSEGLEKLAYLHLFALLGIKNPDIEKLSQLKKKVDKYRINFRWTSASFIEENARLEGLKTKAETAKIMKEVFGESAYPYIIKNIFNLTQSEEELLMAKKEKNVEITAEAEPTKLGGGGGFEPSNMGEEESFGGNEESGGMNEEPTELGGGGMETEPAPIEATPPPSPEGGGAEAPMEQRNLKGDNRTYIKEKLNKPTQFKQFINFIYYKTLYLKEGYYSNNRKMLTEAEGEDYKKLKLPTILEKLIFNTYNELKGVYPMLLESQKDSGNKDNVPPPPDDEDM